MPFKLLPVIMDPESKSLTLDEVEEFVRRARICGVPGDQRVKGKVTMRGLVKQLEATPEEAAADD